MDYGRKELNKLLKEDFTIADYNSHLEEIKRLEALKKSLNIKLKADVNWSDVEELQSALQELGLTFINFETFSNNIKDKYWPGKKIYNWDSYGIKLLKNNYIDKLNQTTNKEELEANLKALEAEKSSLEEEKIKLYAKYGYDLEQEDKVPEFDDDPEIEEYENKITELQKKDRTRKDQIESAIFNLFESKCETDLWYACLVFWVYLQHNNHIPNLNEPRDLRLPNNFSAFDHWYEVFCHGFMELNEYDQKDLDNLKQFIYDQKAALNGNDPDTASKFERYKWWLLNQCIKAFSSFTFDFNKALELGQKYAHEHEEIESEIDALSNKVDKCETAWDKQFNYFKNLKQQKADIDKNEDVKAINDKIWNLEVTIHGIERELEHLEYISTYDLTYKDLWDEEFVNQYIIKKYIQYLLKEVLAKYIEELQTNLDLQKDKFGIGKGTGNALTRFRNYKKLVNSEITPEEKAFFMGWLCKHIRGLYVSVMPNGNSEKVFNLLFPNISNYDTSKKTGDNAWDARAGEIRIDSANNINAAIQDIFNKLTSLKTQTGINNDEQETGRFNGNKLQSAPLVYFLLSEFYNYGFHLGDIEISQDEAFNLQQKYFPNNEKEFDKGFNS